MTDGEVTSHGTAFHNRVAIALLVFILLIGAFLRMYGLGSRSLWADEFCTWHVSRMEFGESLRWAPELTKPPLYQLCLRAISRDPHPPEWLLRLPACIAGVLTIFAAFALGRVTGGLTTGLSAAGLLACNLLQVQYSQEARPYSFLVLGASLSMLWWHHLVRKPTWSGVIMYVVTTALTFHANYLMCLVVLAQGLWLALCFRGRPRDRDLWRPIIALTIAAVLCAPMVIHYLRWRSSTFQGLGWIKPPTWSDALAVLEKITYGPFWVVVVLVPALLLWIMASIRNRAALCPLQTLEKGSISGSRTVVRLFDGPLDLCGLLLVWLVCSWFGLMVISWIAHPAMVDRYALPAAMPAILLPLIVAHRLDRRLPVVLLTVFATMGVRDWTQERLDVEPGFRELSKYLAEAVDPEKDAIVLTIDRKTHPDWDDAERLAFQYYPVRNYPIKELLLAPDGVTAMNDVFRDPRGMYLVVLWADPFAILKAADRRPELFMIEGQTYTQLLFSPYRVIRVSPMD